MHRRYRKAPVMTVKIAVMATINIKTLIVLASDAPL
jgi:hypothetical protein